MSGLSLQFYALPHETINAIKNIFEDPSLFVVKAVGAPPSFHTWNHDTGEMLDPESQLRALAINLEPMNVAAKSLYDFKGLNPDSLILEIGRISSSELAQSWLSTISVDEVSMKRWRKIRKQLTALMNSGVIARNPDNGATGTMKMLYYSNGAKKAYEEGVTILPIAGGSVFHLP